MPQVPESLYDAVSRQFLRAVRGKRSQVAFSRRLGFSSNVAAEWESGRRVPRVTTVFDACLRSGIDIDGALKNFWPPHAALLTDLESPTVARWLDAHRGKEAIATVSRRAALSRHQVARILCGETEPRLQQFFALVHACSGRLSDLVAACVDIEQIPELRAYHRRTTISRQLAFEEPWTSAMISALECLAGVSCEQAEADLASMFELPREDVQRYLKHLVQANVIARKNKRYVLSEPLLIDTGTRSQAARRLTNHWASVGAQRALLPRPEDVFAFNVFSVSRADFEFIAQLQREHFQRVRAIVAKSDPQTVVVMNLQLMAFASER
jgi:transcriptional regulator with XRE-family HTH domain